jgi:hypothetical protein
MPSALTVAGPLRFASMISFRRIRWRQTGCAQTDRWRTNLSSNRKSALASTTFLTRSKLSIASCCNIGAGHSEIGA